MDSGLGTRLSLSHVDPLPDGEHLMLGITIDGIKHVLDRIGFPWVDYDFHCRPSCYHPGSYKRDPALLGWISEKYGDGFQEVLGERVFVGTGYDLAECIRAWLAATGKKELSVCEVLRAEGSPHVKKPTLFQSHQQSFPIGITLLYMQSGMFWHRKELPVTSSSLSYRPRIEAAGLDPATFERSGGTLELFDQVHWLDYFVLRQCKSDFKVEEVRRVIENIGCTQVEVDTELTYVDRSFCVLEAYCTIASRSKMLCQTLLTPDSMLAALAAKPVRVQDAAARRDKDKRMIDTFIAEQGADLVNFAITRALILGAGAGGEESRGGAIASELQDLLQYWDMDAALSRLRETCREHEDTTDLLWGLLRQMQRAMERSKGMKDGQMAELRELIVDWMAKLKKMVDRDQIAGLKVQIAGRMAEFEGQMVVRIKSPEQREELERWTYSQMVELKMLKCRCRLDDELRVLEGTKWERRKKLEAMVRKRIEPHSVGSSSEK